MKTLKKHHLNIIKTKLKFDILQERLESELKSLIDFRFAVVFLSGDEWMILNEDTSNVARIDSCFEIIETEGKLTEHSHNKISI